jgi:hypothetical protein
MPKLPLLALAVGLLAALMSGTIWLSFAGAPLGVVGLGLGLVAVRNARRRGEGTRTAVAAVVVSALAILVLPVVLVACNTAVSCV